MTNDLVDICYSRDVMHAKPDEQISACKQYLQAHAIMRSVWQSASRKLPDRHSTVSRICRAAAMSYTTALVV